jgi:hypothetical protein
MISTFVFFRREKREMKRGSGRGKKEAEFDGPSYDIVWEIAAR